MNEPSYTNPYYAPTPFAYPTPQLRLASRVKRLLGVVIDNVAMLLGFIPGFMLIIAGTMFVGPQGNEELALSLMLGGVGLTFLGIVVAVCIQIYLLAVSSQTIGKYLLKMQIIDYQTHQRSSFVQCFLLRSVVGMFLLGQVPFYSLIDACFIFREDYRCIHDLIANSIVVDLDS